MPDSPASGLDDSSFIAPSQQIVPQVASTEDATLLEMANFCGSGLTQSSTGSRSSFLNTVLHLPPQAWERPRVSENRRTSTQLAPAPPQDLSCSVVAPGPSEEGMVAPGPSEEEMAALSASCLEDGDDEDMFTAATQRQPGEVTGRASASHCH